MEANEIHFETPSFPKRIKEMMSVDFYRLFHTPLLYIFLAIAAIIPAMILTMTGKEGSTGVYSNVWEAIAIYEPIYVVKDIGQYANMNMVFIFGGIMVSIFIGHDYRSGYVKQLFTTHPKKQDYIISKTLTCTFSIMMMCITYLMGSVIAGLIVRLPFDIDVGSLLCAIIGKLLMSFGWASLYTFLNIIFRKMFGISILSSFFFGTGITIIGMSAIFGNSAFLNIFLYGSSVYACLSSNFLTIIICLVVSLAWSVIYNLLGTLILNRSDIY